MIFFDKCFNREKDISDKCFLYTQVVDNGRIIKSFFWIIMDHYSQDAHWMMITSNQILAFLSGI